jgi:hypothetical protein
VRRRSSSFDRHKLWPCSVDARWQAVPPSVPSSGALWQQGEDEASLLLARQHFRFAYAQSARPKHTVTSLSISLSDVKLTRLESQADSPHARQGREAAFATNEASLTSPRSRLSGSSHTAGAQDWPWWAPHSMGTIRSVSMFQAPVPPSSADDKARPVMVMMDCVHLIMTEAARCAFVTPR